MLVILCYWQIQYVALRALKIAFQLCCFWATRGALSYYMIFPSKTWKKCILRETQGVEILIKYIVGYTEEVMTSRPFFLLLLGNTRQTIKTAIWKNTHLFYLRWLPVKETLATSPVSAPARHGWYLPLTIDERILFPTILRSRRDWL